MAVNLEKHREEIVAAWKDVLDQKSSTDWALFGYEGLSNDLKVVSKGDGGIEELKDELCSGQIMYAFLKVIDPKTSLPKCVLINWQGEGAPLVRKGTCANHIRDITNLLHGAHVTINARNDEEVDEDVVVDKVSKCTASSYSFNHRSSSLENRPASVGTAYQRVNAKNEINIMERDKFWEKEEEEEKKRLAEEKKKKEELKRVAEQQRLQMESEKKAERASPERSYKRNESVREEAKELIKANKNCDLRAIFEKNVSRGQIVSNKSPAISPHVDEISPSEAASCPVIPDLCREASEGGASLPAQSNKISLSLATRGHNEYHSELEGGPSDALMFKEQQITQFGISRKEYPAEVSSSTTTSTFPNLQDEEWLGDKYNGSELLDFANEGLRAEALYDYQAADETEISFDPGDIITHIDQIDTGWWQGLAPDGTFGLFPANYVQLLP